MIGAELRWQAGQARYPARPGARHKIVLPRSTATTPDLRTAIEIIGAPDAMRQISLVGQLIDEASARQNAAYAALVLRLIVPGWSDADAWLTTALRWVREGEVGICVNGWQITLTWTAATRMLILKALR